MHSKIVDALIELGNKQAKIESLEPLVLLLEELGHSVYTVHTDGFIAMYKTVDTKDEVTDILISLAKAGYHQVDSVDIEKSSIRYWLGKEKGKLMLMLTIAFSGIKCRQVQVGTREVPVYNIICEGDSLESFNEPQEEALQK